MNAPAPTELLPCPFCGSTNLKSGGDDKFVGTRCVDCEASGPNHYGKTDWNTRQAASVGAEAAADWIWKDGKPVGAEVAGEAKRVTGCLNQIEEAACLIWDELCPGMVMGDADLPHYEAAAKAVLALASPSRSEGVSKGEVQSGDAPYGKHRVEHDGVVLECNYAVPGLTLHDLTMIFERATKSEGVSENAADPSKWPTVRGVIAVTDAVKSALSPTVAQAPINPVCDLQALLEIRDFLSDIVGGAAITERSRDTATGFVSIMDNKFGKAWASPVPSAHRGTEA